MYLRRDQLTWFARAPAKLNLYLEILGRRDDGFHTLETLMVPIGLSDSLRFTNLPEGATGQFGEIVLDVRECFPVRESRRQSPIPKDGKNLVVRALELLRERSGCRFGARVELAKRIPAGAGLGGGSSDAATALRLANRAWGLDWPLVQLSEMAAEIGSDVPFFLSSGPAICGGRGEQVEPIHGMKRMHFVVVKPPVELSTADVYRVFDELEAGEKKVGVEDHRDDRRWSREWRLIDSRQPRNGMRNRLQEAAATVSPWVGRLRAVFEKLDVLGHQLSGSGSAYFGICRHAAHARRLATVLRTLRLGLVYATRSCA